MKIIGRDSLLKNEIYPRVKSNKGFIVTGQRGIGKTVILKWAYDNYGGDKVLLSCRESYGQIINHIAEVQGLETKKKKVVEIEKEITKGKKITLFIDDLEKITPKQASLIIALNEIWSVYLSGLEPFREESKRILWGKNKVKIRPIEKKDRDKLAEECIKATGSLVAKNVIATESKGVPGRAWAIAKGEYVREDKEHVEGEEINIAPVLLLFIAGLMVTRYIGLGLGEKDLYILGGMGMSLSAIFRYYVFYGMKK